MAKTWRDVYPGQDWKFPDGEVWHIGAVMWDGTERTALCTSTDGGVLHVPAATLVDQAEQIALSNRSTGPEETK